MTRPAEIPWLESFARSWRDRVAQGRVPHAVLLAGPPGVGKRAAAVWMIRAQLGRGATDLPTYPYEPPQHADLHWLTTPEDKTGILIDQVRELVSELSLTSYEGGGKIAVIEPANAMTANAANSLLKTLEEPPGDALMILVADRLGRLPATILSRCQRIDIRPPAEADGLAWLDRLSPGSHWPEALRLAGGAPLAAIAAADQLDTHAALAKDLAALATGAASPVAVAARWAKIEPRFVLDWLARQARLAILASTAGRDRAPGLAIGESVLQRMDSRNLFCYLDAILKLRGQPPGSWNAQLTFEELAIDWAEGLANCGRDAVGDGLDLIRAGR